LVEEQFRIITLNHKECGIFIIIEISLWNFLLIKEFHSDFIPHIHYKSCNFQHKHYKKKKHITKPTFIYLHIRLLVCKRQEAKTHHLGIRAKVSELVWDFVCGWLGIRNIKDCGLKQIVFFELDFNWNDFSLVDCDCLYSSLNLWSELKDIVVQICMWIIGNWYTMTGERDEVLRGISLEQVQLIRLQWSHNEIWE
jgi:hypothetical protein